MRSARQDPNYREDIDGLRGLAVFAVVVYHYAPSALPSGYLGVDLFFVVSGYLITRILLRDHRTHGASLAHFYYRRVLRLAPALGITLALCTVAADIQLYPDERFNFAKESLAGIAFVANVLFWTESGYFDREAAVKPLLHLWSLGVEEQFYLIWPTLIYLIRHRAPQIQRRALLAVAGLSFLAMAVLSARDEAAAFYLPMSRFWQLIAGAFIATYQPTPGNGRQQMCASAALIFLISCFLTDTSFLSRPGAPSVVATLLGVSLIAWPRRNSLLNFRPLVQLGLISYPLYLLHWPILYFARLSSHNDPSPQILALAVGSALLLSYCIWRFFETPIRSNNGTFRLCLTIVCLVASGIWSARTLRYEEQTTTNDDWPMATEPVCMATYGPRDGYCRLSKAGPPTIILVGDSHADHLFPGLSAKLHESSESLLHLGDNGCPPLLRVRRNDLPEGKCRSVEQAFNIAFHEKSIHTVILAARWPMFAAGERDAPIHNFSVSLVDLENPEETELQSIVSHALERTLAALFAAGKRVIFVHAPPELGFDPITCGRPRTVTFSPPETRCELSLKTLHQRDVHYRDALAAVLARHPEVAVIDPRGILCDARACLGYDGPLPTYRDNNHLSMHGSTLIAQSLVDVLLRQHESMTP